MASEVDKILQRMRDAGSIQDVKEKGAAGEEAVLNVCLQRKRQYGGLLYQSFTYPYQTNKQNKCYLGNIVMNGGSFKDYTNATLHDEIDILYVTNYRIFIIEVKSYHADMLVYDHWLKKNGDDVDKSPITQTEKHARHLYHAISDVIPDGNPRYIVPLCCFVDRCKIKDERSDKYRYYIPISILNNFKKKFVDLNTPLDYNLDMNAIARKLSEIKISTLKEFL